MDVMSKSEVQSLDNDMLLRWLTFLSRYRAEEVGLHVDSEGKWVIGEKRPSLEDVEDELVRRGLDDGPKISPSDKKGAIHDAGRHNR